MSRRTRKRKKRDVIVPVAAMGDIAFLLIIFFMVCSNFARDAGINVEPPTSPQITEIQRGQVSVSVDTDEKIYVNGEETASAEGVTAALEDLLAGAGERVVELRCDKSVRNYMPIMRAISKAGANIDAIGEDEPSSPRQ